jgi:hypothetical protein
MRRRFAAIRCSIRKHGLQSGFFADVSVGRKLMGYGVWQLWQM